MKNKKVLAFVMPFFLTTLLSHTSYAEHKATVITQPDQHMVQTVDPSLPKTSKHPQLKNGQQNVNMVLDEADYQLTPEEKEFLAEKCDIILNKAITQLNETDKILEYLALIVHNGVAKTKNKGNVFAGLKNLRQLVDQVKSIAINHSHDVSKINLVLHITDGIVDHIYYAVRRGLTSLPKLKIANILGKIKKNKMPTFDDFQKKLKQTDTKIKNLDNASKKVGLAWYNRFYRFLDDSTKTVRRYSVPWRTLEALTIGAAGFYLIYRFTDWFKDLKVGGKKVVGEAPVMNEYGHIKNTKKLGMLGKVESNLAQFTRGMLPIGTLLMWAAPKMVGDEWKKFKKWSSPKLESVHNKMLGGVAKKRSGSKYDLKPRWNFNHVVGLEHIKSELRIILKYLENPERFERTGNVPPKGIICTGKPGTGKSFVIEAFAGEIEKMLGRNNDFKFLKIDVEDINEHGIDTILEVAQDYAPCIIFIDEIDLLGLQRTEEREKLNKFLTSMSGYLDTNNSNIKDQVILIAATNRPENLDPALLRFGRFGKKLHFEYPTFSERRKYLIRRLNPIIANLNKFDIEKIARETEGYTYEALNAIIRKSFQKTIIKGDSLTQSDLDKALNSEVRHIIVDGRTLPEHEKKIIAAHQSGCALASMLLDPYQKVSCVTINPVMKHIEEQAVFMRFYKKQNQEIQHGKLFTYRDKDTINIDTKDDLLTHCKINLAGSIGEEILGVSSGNSYNTDSNQQALEIALRIISEGIDLENMPKNIKATYYQNALNLVQTCKNEVRTLLTQNKAHLENLSQALLTYKTLNAEQIQQLMKGENIGNATMVDSNEQPFIDFKQQPLVEPVK